MKQKSVSVIIPTYRHRDFILATLESVFAQTYTDYEIIVVNDGSPDDTADVLAPLRQSGRIRYIEQANAGQAAARNRGIAEAQGEFIALLDDDDLWPTDKLEWQVAALAAHPDAGMVVGTAETFREGDPGARLFPLPEQMTETTFFHSNPILTPGQTLIRKTLLEEISGFDPQVWGADDWDLWFRISRAARILVDQRQALYYREHAGNASKQTGRMFQASCAVAEKHLRMVDAKARRTMARSVGTCLYEYLGVRKALQIKQDLAAGKFRAAHGNVCDLYKLSELSMWDKDLQRRMIADAMPGAVRRVFRA